MCECACLATKVCDRSQGAYVNASLGCSILNIAHFECRFSNINVISNMQVFHTFQKSSLELNKAIIAW